MPEGADAIADEVIASAPRTASWRKRWRAWLRAIHRDVGYLAVGFTVIYALLGIAMNHIDDWAPNFHATEITRTIAPVTDVRLSYPDRTKLTAIYAHVSRSASTTRRGTEP